MILTTLLFGLFAAGLLPAVALAAETGGGTAREAAQAAVYAAPVVQAAVYTAPAVEAVSDVTQAAVYAAPTLQAEAVLKLNPVTAIKAVRAVYRVKTGDSLKSIGKKFGVSEAAILTINKMTGDRIFRSQWLIIPAPELSVGQLQILKGNGSETLAGTAGNASGNTSGSTPVTTPAPAPEAAAATTPAAAPAAAPAPAPATTLAPTPATTPAPTPETTPAPTPDPVPQESPAHDATVKHTVQQGDSLYLIAQKYWVSVAALKSANGLTSDFIDVGQVLVIPASANRTGPPVVSREIALSREDFELLAKAVYAEARGETYEGQVAVVAVILNRYRHPDFPKTIREIIYQALAFESVDDGQIYLAPNAQAYQAVQDALNGWDPSDGALYFWNPDRSTSQWIKTRTVTKRIGNHVFGI